MQDDPPACVSFLGLVASHYQLIHGVVFACFRPIGVALDYSPVVILASIC